MQTGKQSRVGKQIRERYLHHLDPNLKKGAWTPEEVLYIYIFSLPAFVVDCRAGSRYLVYGYVVRPR